MTEAAAWLVKWRAGRHRAAIWKSLVLPAGGAALCWLLLLTLWLPLLDYARSYKKLALDVARATGTLSKQGGGQPSGLIGGQYAACRTVDLDDPSG